MKKIIFYICISLIVGTLFLYSSFLRFENITLRKTIDEQRQIILLQNDSVFLANKIYQLDNELKKLHEEINKKDSIILQLKQLSGSSK